jgi:hypothetical protein
MINMKLSTVAVVGIFLLSIPVFAHHGTAVSYDQNKLVRVKGIVKEFSWRNPHSALFLEGKDEAGNAVTYSLEMGSPNVLAKLGYTRYIMKPGDEVEMEMHPSFTTPTSGEADSRHHVIINGKELHINNAEGN